MLGLKSMQPDSPYRKTQHKTGNLAVWKISEWIVIFRCLVHESGRRAGEKLTILKRYLEGSCQDLVHGLGGGKEAYKEGLLRLEETCRRRGVLRAFHVQKITGTELYNIEKNMQKKEHAYI